MSFSIRKIGMLEMPKIAILSTPKSDDPEYWNYWTKSEGSVDWKPISDKWQNNS